jgi:hypothetical protein
MSICQKCGYELGIEEEVCSKCGTKIINPSSQIQLKNDYSSLKNAEIPKANGWGEITQSRGAIIAVIVIALFIDVLNFISLATGSAKWNSIYFGAFLWDIICTIYMLRGKRWARTLMLIRVIIGLVIWSAVSLINNDYFSVFLQIAISVPLILLLTGHTTKLRLWGSVTLFIILFLAAFVLSGLYSQV